MSAEYSTRENLHLKTDTAVLQRRRMFVDGALLVENLGDVESKIREIERLGYDGLYTFEGAYDPLLPLTLAASFNSELRLSTQVAIAFTRNPLQFAYMANDLQRFCKGRLTLGLGTQVKQNIEQRFGMPWGKPVTRMREFVGALRAIYACWNDGEKLNYESEYYRHTKMQPMFTPKPNPYGAPTIMLGGVGKPMTRLAGEVADAFIVIPFHTPTFLESHTLPAIDEGLAKSGRTRGDFQINAQCMIATGIDEKAHAVCAGFLVCRVSVDYRMTMVSITEPACIDTSPPVRNRNNGPRNMVPAIAPGRRFLPSNWIGVSSSVITAPFLSVTEMNWTWIHPLRPILRCFCPVTVVPTGVPLANNTVPSAEAMS